MAIAEVSIVPIGSGEVSVSKYIAEAIQELKQSGLKFQLTPMGTIIEGQLEELMNVIKRMHEVPFGKGIKRVYTTIKLDDRRDRTVAMHEKVKSVKEKLSAQDT